MDFYQISLSQSKSTILHESIILKYIYQSLLDRNYHQRRVNSQALQVSIIYSMMGMFICKHEPF